MYTMSTKQAPAILVMFCHDSTNIYYPTAPGRVYIVDIAALSDCDGSDEDYSDSTVRGDVSDMLSRYVLMPVRDGVAPMGWLIQADTTDEEADSDFCDIIESWADWCDRDSVRLDSLDEVLGAIERAA